MNHILPFDFDHDVVEIPRDDRFRWLLALRIQGLEVTQAIQYYRAASHLTDPADRASNNAVKLIAGKPAWVRVYLRSLVGEIANVTGTLEVSRRQYGLFYAPIATLAPQAPGVATARSNPAYAIERGTLSYTLNFILPANLMCGSLRLRARVNAPGGYSHEFTEYFDVTLQQTLRVRGIMVGYNGPQSSAPGAPNINLPAPTLANLQTTSAWTLLTFPVRSAATYGNAGTIVWNRPLTDAPSCPGCCTPNWVALNAAVQAQKIADGNLPNVLYYGLMAVGIPMGPIVGCNSGGVSTGANGGAVTMAHELGHACGLPHAPCGTPGDPNYPAYEPYDPAATPQASIGEYGLDISNGAIKSPLNFKDWMSYCGPKWISLYNYGQLTNNANLAPARVCMDHLWWPDEVRLYCEKCPPDDPFKIDWRQTIINPDPVISLIGVVHSENQIEINSLMRVEAIREISNGAVTDLIAELVDAQGQVLAGAPLYRLRSQGQGGCGCGDANETPQSRYPYLFQAFVSNVEVGALLRIRRGDKVMWSRRAPASEPRIVDFKVRLARGQRRKGRKNDDQLLVEWQIKSAGEQKPEIWVQWSNDRGKTWYVLATGLNDKRATLEAGLLPSGRVLIRLLAGDGFYTAVSQPVAVQVPGRGPAVSILAPREDQTFVAGESIRLWGAATRSNGEPVADNGAHWLLNGKAVGKGLDLFITAPAVGEYSLTLVVTADGKKAEHGAKFKTVKVPKERE